jgi:hypothetical protein
MLNVMYATSSVLSAMAPLTMVEAVAANTKALNQITRSSSGKSIRKKKFPPMNALSWP